MNPESGAATIKRKGPAARSGPLRWGVLGLSRFALKKSVPRMRTSEKLEIHALASRDVARATEVAGQLGIPKAYGSYDDLLKDPQIDVVYVPLPISLHLEWSSKAARAGKHVLCEKPIALTGSEARLLYEVQQQTGVTMAEACMVRSHPQWIKAKELVQLGRIGELRQISYTFAYYNIDAANIRNIAELGGGALLDIGCYVVNTARWLYETEPDRVFAFADFDPVFRTDRLISGILEFKRGHATFSCATQLNPFERVQLHGTKGRIELRIPLKAPPEVPSRMLIDNIGSVFEEGIEVLELPLADQFVLQAEAFSAALLEGRDPPNCIGDAVKSMLVLDALRSSISSGRAEAPR